MELYSKESTLSTLYKIESMAHAQGFISVCVSKKFWNSLVKYELADNVTVNLIVQPKFSTYEKETF